jgi:hypothetical protein
VSSFLFLFFSFFVLVSSGGVLGFGELEGLVGLDLGFRIE